MRMRLELLSTCATNALAAGSGRIVMPSRVFFTFGDIIVFLHVDAMRRVYSLDGCR